VVVAKLAVGTALLSPAIQPDDDSLLDAAQGERMRQRLARWLENYIARILKPLIQLRAADLPGGAARGLVFQLLEAGGLLERHAVAELLHQLDKDGRRTLARLGIHLGLRHIFMADLLKPAALGLLGLLYAVKTGQALPLALPTPGRVSVPLDSGSPATTWAAIGYIPLGSPGDGRAIRVDMLDRLERLLQDSAHPLQAVDAARLAGVKPAELEPLLAALGYAREETADGKVTWKQHRPAKAATGKRGHRRGPPLSPDHPFAMLEQLKGKR
jgi:ATP-dependent RNA helicase SUPV3L1/SUV3